MTEDDFKKLESKVEQIEHVLQSLVISHVGIEDLNGEQIEIVGNATRHIQDRAYRYRDNRQLKKIKHEIEEKIWQLQQELSQYD
jgi:uncharacterized protein YdeI (BOF family)